MIKITKRAKHILILIFLSYLFFMLGNNFVSLTNPDEVFYAGTAKEMIKHNSWLTQYLFDEPQFEKPVFTSWLLRLGFMFFGISNFSARFFPALFAILGVIAAYLLGVLGYRDDKKAFISALILMSSGLYIGLARTLFTDMIFTVFILLALVSFFWAYCCHKRKAFGIILFFVFCGLAVLTKGPLGLLIPALIVFFFLLIRGALKFILCPGFFWGVIIFMAVSLPWYILTMKMYGHVFTHEFFYNDHFRRIIEAEHLRYDTWYFYPFSMIADMFPWSLLTLAAVICFLKNLKYDFKPIHVFLACWICVVFFVFQAAHSKLPSYIFPLFPAMGLITGDFVYGLALSKPESRRRFFISLAVFFSIILIPIGLGTALLKHSSYVPDKTPVYILLCIYAGLALLSMIFVIRRDLLKNSYLLVISIFIFLWSFLFMHAYAEPSVSSKASCDYLLKNYNVEGYILCSKPFARGVRYYTDRPVAVVNIHSSEENFFSPHPIPYLHTGEELIEFLKKQPVTYCILKKSSVDEIKGLAGKKFSFTLLKVVGNEHVFVVSFIHKL